MPIEGNPLLETYERIQYNRSMYEPGVARDLPNIMGRWGEFNDARHRYAYAVPTDDALDVIASYAPIVEIGAGTGYWAALLAVRGVDVIAYDYRPPLSKLDYRGFPQETNDYCQRVQYHDVRICDPECDVVQEHADRALFLCWPPTTPMAWNSLRYYEGDMVIYVGEPDEGATADRRFFKLLRKEWHEVMSFGIPQWYGLHDYLSIWKRNEK